MLEYSSNLLKKHVMCGLNQTCGGLWPRLKMGLRLQNPPATNEYSEKNKVIYIKIHFSAEPVFMVRQTILNAGPRTSHAGGETAGSTSNQACEIGTKPHLWPSC